MFNHEAKKKEKRNGKDGRRKVNLFETIYWQKLQVM